MKKNPLFLVMVLVAAFGLLNPSFGDSLGNSNSAMAFRNPSHYILTPMDGRHENRFHFTLGYTLGIHRGHAKEVQGEIELDRDNWEGLRGSFSIPIEAITSGDKTRDCHMREALGLNYGLSEFPERHVCDANDHLPMEGVNSVAYPTIQFRIHRAQLISGRENPNSNLKVRVFGTWTIHGQQVEKSHEMDLTFRGTQGEFLTVEGRFPLYLSDFDVHVKAARVLGIAITVRNRVNVNIRFTMKKRSI